MSSVWVTFIVVPPEAQKNANGVGGGPGPWLLVDDVVLIQLNSGLIALKNVVRFSSFVDFRNNRN